MYRIGGMELVGLSREEGVMISWLPEGLGIELAQQKLENVKKQHEAEMENLCQQLEGQKEHSDHVDRQLRSQYSQAMSSLREALQDSGQQKELDAVVGQLQELHQRQLQQLNAQHMHDTALQVTAARLTVEQVQTSRLKLVEENHQTAIQQLDKQHKEQLNALQARPGSANADGMSPLSASEELTQKYQDLVQRINQSLEKEVLERLHGDKNEQDEAEDSKTQEGSGDAISMQQAEAIQQVLQAQQEEVLTLRSKLLQEYETMLQQRSEGVSQQTEDVQRLQDQMVELQQQYEKQIAKFEQRISQYNEQDELRHTEQQQRDRDLEEVKAKYEQRIADLEQSFSTQISALQQTALVPTTSAPLQEAVDVNDGGDTGQVGEDSADSASESLSLRLAEERDYVHKTATLTAISDVDSDTADSPRNSTEPSRLQHLQNSLKEKTARIEELEKCLGEEREKMGNIANQLDSASQKLNDLSSQLEQQVEVNQTLQKSLEERDRNVEEALEEKAESEKLLRELTEKEEKTAKERDDLMEQLRCMQEAGSGDSAFLASTPTVEEELKKLRVSLDESALALQAAEAREQELREKLSDAQHQHTEALEELRQELEHEAQMERETLQSEFRVQLDVELKRQASELEQKFSEQTKRNSDSGLQVTADSASVPDRTVDDADSVTAPDLPHSGNDVEAALTVSKNVPFPFLASHSPESQDSVITEPLLTDQHSESLQASADVQEVENHVGDSGTAVCEEGQVRSCLPTTISSGADSLPSGGANAQSTDVVLRQSVETELRTDFDTQLAELCRQFETEKTQLVKTYQERVEELETLLGEAEDKYNKLKEDIEQSEGAGVDTLLKDRYDMELELAKNLMQQEFDDSLQAEKKKFVERHRKLMDDFMSDRESEAAEIKQKHQQELEDLRSSLTSEYNTQTMQLQTELQELKNTDAAQTVCDKNTQSEEKSNGIPEEAEESGELNRLKEELQDVKDQLETTKSEHAESSPAVKELQDIKEQLEATRAQHAEALAALREEYEARISELKSSHQEELEAAALDTDVIKSELEQAHQAEVKRLQEQLQEQLTAQGDHEQAAAKTATVEKETSKMTAEGSQDGDKSPDVRSSLEYEETDEEGSVHSFSSLLGKTRSFADVVKSTPPSSPQRDQRIKQLEAQIERLTQQLAQQTPQDIMTATVTTTTASPPPTSRTASAATSPPPQASATAAASQADGGDQNLVTMLQSDLDRISAERDSVQQTNNRLLQLLSDSVHTYVEVEDTINRRLHSVVAASVPRPHTPTHLLRPDNHGDLVTPRGAGLSSFTGALGDRGAVGGAIGVSSPQSERSWRLREADNSSPTLEETSILSNATDEGLDISQRLTESIFTGPDIDAEGEEIVSDARGRLQNAVSRLLELIERTTQQLLEAKATQADLLETMAARTKDNDDLAARLHDLEEQVRQEVAAKEYLGLELHKAEGLISGYSSEREALEEQLQALEEQKEVLASDLETTRSRLQEFQQATGELEARRQDVERQQTLLQENAGQETQESTMAGGDATVSKRKALLTEMNSLTQESREQSLQLQHRLTQAERRLQERETTLEEMEKEHQRQTEELRRQVEDLKLQVENTERQLKSNKQFLDEQMTEREQEREEFQKEVEKLKTQLQNKEKQTHSEGRLHYEIQDLTEQLQARIESQTLMHQQTQELQQSLQERDLSAQELRVWINTLEQELDQRGDTEEQLKGRIQNLERRLTIGEADSQSDTSVSLVPTPRPDSPSSMLMSPTRPAPQRRQSRISLEDELRRSRQAEEELVHEKEALQKTVQEQLLQISALRNQLDEMRHWTAPTDPNASSSSTADLREQLDTERERLEKNEEELSKLKADQEDLEKELTGRRQEVDQLKQQLHDTAVATERIRELEEERNTLQSRMTELSDADPFPPELLDEKNAEIEDLRQQLSRIETDFGSLEVQLKEKEELVSDLQDTVHSLQRGESCLDVSLSFNEPMPLNASFTERLQEEERPSSVTSLAQELDQTVGEAQIADLTLQVEQLSEQLAEQQEQLEQLQGEKTALESDLQQRDEDFSQLQEEKTQKHEQLVERESRLEQLVEQINGLHTEITSLTTFQVELQKDFDTVQSMLDEKERDIESMTKELLDSRSHTEESDVSDLEAELAAVQRQLREQHNVVDEKEEELYELNEKLEAMEAVKSELESLKTQLAERDEQHEKDRKTCEELKQKVLEKTEQLEKERKSHAELQQELEEIQRMERAGRSRAHSFPSLNVKPMEDQVRELKAEVFHLEGVVKKKEELIRYLEEEKTADSSQRDKDLADLHLQLIATQEHVATRVAELEGALRDKQQQLTDTESQKQQELDDLQQQLSGQAATVQQLETEQQTLQQHTEEHRAIINGLQREVARLEEELEQAKSQSIATDDVKALQERLQRSSERVGELEHQVTSTQTRLDQTSTQLAEREDQIQQLQTEVQTLQQEARQRQLGSQTPENLSRPRTPESSEDSEADERLKDVLSRAQHMQARARSSLSSSLPLSAHAEMSSLARWDSEPGLSSSMSPEIAVQAQEAETWFRRQQREMAAQNRELATVREELEAWMRRKDRATKTSEYSASVMTMTLRLQEKEVLIASLKRELKETKELLAAAEKSTAETSSTGSQQLSLQMQQQMAHLRSELQRARSALSAMQEQTGMESDTTDAGEDREQLQKLEAELRLLRSSTSSSAEDFAQKVEELREELTLEHQRHIHDIQETARQDLEVKLTELQSRHDHEMQQLQQLHQRKLDQALMQQQQELEKEHKTELNHLRVLHQQEIDRLRSEELASLTEASVAQNLRADVLATQQMDQHMIDSLTTEDGVGNAGSTSSVSEACPPHIQALLDRLREAGEHILSVSELDLLRRHLSPPRDMAPGSAVQEAWEGEKLALVKTVHALKELLSQADRVSAGLEESGVDWRSNLINGLVEVYRRERLGLEAELHTLRLQQPGQEHGNTLKNFDNRLREQEQLHQSGLDAMLRAERQSLLSELEELQTRLSQQRQEQQDLRAHMTESLAQHEENASNKTWKLQREVQVLEYKLQQEKVIEEDLRKGLEAERRRVAELSSELSRDKGTLISVQSELQSTQLQLSRTKDALEREQNRFTSVTDALEEEREKNNHLSDKLETLRRQHNSLESDAGRSEVVRRERQDADSRFIKELQAELASEREQLHKAVEVVEEERRQRKQLQAGAEREHQHVNNIKQEMEKLHRQTKRTLEAEAAELSDMQSLVQREQERVHELERLLADRDTTNRQLSNRVQQLEDQVQQMQNKWGSLQQQLDTEKQKGESLVTLMDSEREQQVALQEQELAKAKQLRADLSQAKTEAGEARRHLELEKTRSDSLRLELERAQSELRALTQHAGATERQLETEHSSTWNKLRLAKRERDDLQVKVHELELELDRLQDRLQDLELELDRSRQRELEARHDVERHKLYPSASPRSAPTTPRGTADPQLQSRLNAFCKQIHSVGQRLQTLTLKQRDYNDSLTEKADNETEAEKMKSSVTALLAELQALQSKMAAGEEVEPQPSSESLTQEMEQLQGTVDHLRKEKEELQRRLTLLEDENNQRTPRPANTVHFSNNHQDGLPQYASDVTTSDEEFLYERTVWATERLSLQMALDSAEHEIDRLKKELRSFRGRFNSEGFMVEADRDKMQRLYGKYLRAESFRKALVYQKKYLLLLLGGYQDSEQDTLAVIATMGGQPSSTFDLVRRRRHRRLYTIFRSAARMVVAIFRMKYLVRKWKRAMRVGSPVVSGRVSQQYGYVATPSSFIAPNNSELQVTTGGTSAYLHTLNRGIPPTVANGNMVLREYSAASSHPAGEIGRRFYTPPTKDINQSHRSSDSPSSSSARRQLMAELDLSHHTSSGAEGSENGASAGAHAGADRDDFIQRLENLQSRLSSSSNNGENIQHRPSWR